MHQDEVAVAVVGVKRARTLFSRTVCVLVADELERFEESRARAEERRHWWLTALQKRAPRLSGGDGTWRGGKRYGLGSNYGRDHVPRLSPDEYYSHFRFAPTEIPRVVVNARMPALVRTRGGCVTDGEEALLIYLKVASFILSYFIFL